MGEGGGGDENSKIPQILSFRVGYPESVARRRMTGQRNRVEEGARRGSLTAVFALQYGFVNHALELLVIRNYGPEVWEDIK